MLNAKLCSHYETYLEPSRAFTMEPFSLRLSQTLKVYIIDQIAFRVHFYTTHPFVEKLTTVNTLGEKRILLTIEQFFFFLKSETTQWNAVINKEHFLN